MIPGSFPVLLAPASGEHVIDGSGVHTVAGVRSNLTKTFGSTRSSARIFTMSLIIKRVQFGVREGFLYQQANGNSENAGLFEFDASDRLSLKIQQVDSSTIKLQRITTQVFRDPSAWMHIHIAINTGLTTDACCKIHINGTEITDFDTKTNIDTPRDHGFLNSSKELVLMGTTDALSGSATELQQFAYMSRVFIQDGVYGVPTDVGEVTDDGFWQINDASGLTFGTNGFLIEDGDDMAAGTDSSGNSNSFTKTGTITATDDSPTDDAGNNYGDYATMNPLNAHADTTLSQGNLDVDASAANNRGAASTIPMSSGKWYWEATISSGSINGSRDIGICGTDSNFIGTNSSLDDIGLSAVGWLPVDATLRHLTNSTSYGTTGSTGAVVMFALDMDAQKLWIGKDGTWFTNGSVGVPDAGTNAAPTSTVSYTWPDAALAGCTVQTTRGFTYNFGATTFAHPIGASNDTEGFLPISTANLPEPAVANYEDEYYIEAGISHTNGSTTAVTLPKTVSGGAMTRIKRTDSTGDWYVFDTVRGANKSRKWNEAEAEDTSTFSDQNLTGTTLTLPSALATGTYLVEVFYVGSYFQIQTVTGNAGARTITWPSAMDSYGFSAFFPRTGASSPIAHHTSIGAQQILFCDNGSAAANRTNFSQAPNKTDFRTPASVGPDFNLNTIPYVCYGWANSGPYSFGSATANGSADGPFISMYGSPQNLIWKNASASQDWYTTVVPINNGNVMNTLLLTDTTDAAYTSSATLDILSNGAKIRSNGAGTPNTTNGNTILTMAFGIQPIQGNGTDTSQGRAK
jgi:hypothetical protein